MRHSVSLLCYVGEYRRPWLRIDVLQVSLVLNSTFHARNRLRHYTQVVTKKSDTTAVEPGETRSWNSVRLGVPPYIPESRLDGCDMIDIAYELQVLSVILLICSSPRTYNVFKWYCVWVLRICLAIITLILSAMSRGWKNSPDPMATCRCRFRWLNLAGSVYVYYSART